jgi:hypothetical protein
MPRDRGFAEESAPDGDLDVVLAAVGCDVGRKLRELAEIRRPERNGDDALAGCGNPRDDLREESDRARFRDRSGSARESTTASA